MGKINIATSGYTAIQAGSISKGKDKDLDAKIAKALKAAQAAKGKVVNYKGPNARVGIQVDGDVHIRF